MGASYSIKTEQRVDEGEQLLRSHQGDGHESIGAQARRVAVGFASTVVVLTMCAVVAVSTRGGIGGVGARLGDSFTAVVDRARGGVHLAGSSAPPRLVVQHSHLGSGPEEMMQMTSIPEDFISASIQMKGHGENDNAAELGKPGAGAQPQHTLDANVFTITIGGLEEDKAAKMDVVGELGRAFGAESVKRNVHLTPAIIAMVRD